ncbi:hypothetical protein BZA05DRAFT_253942 [Tricharina praecox]|uniref:uncharacterized protein n=1 Tax=Tricharina praecox TaxID=43433 RepID=UPI00221FFF9C|nr:uncharacterized protein BZA05DRAFT_253942 [Tricharina praecox]KAI5854936.1 hypothetical protein BZA05DRAFT_253942 [Tricharina praecox]
MQRGYIIPQRLAAPETTTPFQTVVSWNPRSDRYVSRHHPQNHAHSKEIERLQVQMSQMRHFLWLVADTYALALVDNLCLWLLLPSIPCSTTIVVVVVRAQRKVCRYDTPIPQTFGLPARSFTLLYVRKVLEIWAVSCIVMRTLAEPYMEYTEIPDGSDAHVRCHYCQSNRRLHVNLHGYRGQLQEVKKTR